MTNNPLLSDAVVEAVVTDLEDSRRRRFTSVEQARWALLAASKALTAAGYAVVPEWLPVDSIPADWRDGRHLLGLMDAVYGPASIGELWWVDGWGWRAPVRDREPTPRYVMPLPQPPKEPGQ